MSKAAWMTAALSLFVAGARADEFSYSAYYPSPAGIYNTITTTGRTSLARDGGAVGVGLADPLAALHINAAAPAAFAPLRLQRGGAGAFELRAIDLGLGSKAFSVHDVEAGSDPFYVGPGGNVGIGTTDTSGSPLNIRGALELRGGLRAELRFRPPTPSAITNHWDFGIHEDMFIIHNESPGVANGIAITTNNRFYFGQNVPMSPAAASWIPYRLVFDNGARLTIGGTWENSSSRRSKQDIRELGSAEASEALDRLQPVSFKYKKGPDDAQLGFIAEDVPELVADSARRSLSPLEILAVLTKAIQDQDREIEELKARIKKLSRRQSPEPSEAH